MGNIMKKTCGNEVQLASIPEGMAALFVKGTQKTLDEWKTRSKRKRFRCQNIPVERFDLSLGLTHLFCQNSDYETLRLINDGINLEKKTAIGILQAKIKNLPKKETPHVNKNSNIANIKTSVAEKSFHSSAIRDHGGPGKIIWTPKNKFSKRAISVLSHVFAKNSGYVDGEEIDELKETLDGELTRKQIFDWFCYQRLKEGFTSNKRFSERAKSILSHVFVKNSGYVYGEEVDELKEALDGELTRKQIISWFKVKRKKEGINSTTRKNQRFSERAKSVLSHVFAKNSGHVDAEEVDELEETLGGEMTRKQILSWIWNQRSNEGISSRKSKRAKSILSHVFAKKSGYVDGEEVAELEETLNGEMTRKQIRSWFYYQRKKEGITSKKYNFI